jgi:hypothetical protein
MTFTRVLAVEASDEEATFHLLGDDNEDHPMTVTPEAVSQLQAALIPVAIRLRQTHPDAQHGFVFEATEVRPTVTQNGESLVFVLMGGLELTISVKGLSKILRLCIDRLEHATEPPGPVQ